MFNKVEVAQGFWKRFKGLMFQSEIPEGYALVFPRCKSIHTLFMKCDIDVIYVDGDLRVLCVETMLPWQVNHPHPDTVHVIECAAGAAEKNGVCEGDCFFDKCCSTCT